MFKNPTDAWRWQCQCSCALAALAAAIAACEQRSESKDILEGLAQHLAGHDSIHVLENKLKAAGLSVEGGNVVPFIPQRRRS